VAGEASIRTRCGFCDNCQRGAAPLSADDQLILRKALSCVARMDGRFGRRRVAEVLAGHLSEEVQRAGLQELSTFGLLKDRTVPWLQDLLATLEAAGLVGNSGGEYPTVRLLPAGREVMLDRVRAQVALPGERKAAEPKKRTPRIREKLRSTGAERLSGEPAPGRATLPAPTPPKNAGRGAKGDATDDDLPLTGEEESRFERLRQVRTELARDGKVAPFIIFHDRTLRALARARPRDTAALQRVPGIGETKVQRYGQKVLAALNED
jgi:ATP-dependent DNA helicase RecQ